MSWMKLKFAPGIVKDRTHYAADGTWVDASLVRFREGLPEKWGGWVKALDSFEMHGVCRSLHRFADLTGFQWTGVGTSKRFYVMSDDLYYDVTPIDSSSTINNNPFSTTNTSPIVTVTDTAHGRFAGDVVIFSGATGPVGGFSAGALNTEHTITAYVDDDTYTITMGTNATSTATGGGNAVVADYLFHAGSDGQIAGGGWGAGTWGEEEWGGDPAALAGERMGIWSQDNWGEDLVACAAGGPIFYWDATNPDDRMVDILDLASADGNAPEQAEFIIVSHRDRHLLAFGGTQFSSGVVAPLEFRWCDQEDILNWDETSTTSTAGSLPLSKGSRFIAGINAQREILAWTDAALYSIQYIGAPFIYTAELLDANSDILGMKAAVFSNGVAFWMGRTGIYAYTGRVEKLPCPVMDYVLERLDFSQASKVVAATNRKFNEIIWYYPSIGGDGENDSYVAFDTIQRVWTIGSLARTAWLDTDTLNTPLAAADDGYLYLHEVGADDGSSSPAAALTAYIESAPFELSSEGSYDKGDRFMFIRRILPDVSFRNNVDASVPNPKMSIVLKTMDKPGGGIDATSSKQVTRSATIPIDEYTDEAHVRLRGRALILRAESSTAGTQWRLGDVRIDVRSDGQR